MYVILICKIIEFSYQGIGENDLVTDEFVSNQLTLGSLFKSQNASTWEPSQWEDLKFIFNRAEFSTQGTLKFIILYYLKVIHKFQH